MIGAVVASRGLDGRFLKMSGIFCTSLLPAAPLSVMCFLLDLEESYLVLR